MVSLAFVGAPAGRALAWWWQGVCPHNIALLGVASGAWPLFRLVTASTLLRGSGSVGPGGGGCGGRSALDVCNCWFF